MLARSGLITANVEHSAMELVVMAPLCFDEETVATEGRWSFAPETDPAEALESAYLAAFDSWCARKSAERAAEMPDIGQVRPRHSGIHTPCPALWAGR